MWNFGLFALIYKHQKLFEFAYTNGLSLQLSKLSFSFRVDTLLTSYSRATNTYIHARTHTHTHTHARTHTHTHAHTDTHTFTHAHAHAHTHTHMHTHTIVSCVGKHCSYKLVTLGYNTLHN